jgi:hypothetical protein
VRAAPGRSQAARAMTGWSVAALAPSCSTKQCDCKFWVQRVVNESSTSNAYRFHEQDGSLGHSNRCMCTDVWCSANAKAIHAVHCSTFVVR